MCYGGTKCAMVLSTFSPPKQSKIGLNVLSYIAQHFNSVLLAYSNTLKNAQVCYGVHVNKTNFLVEHFILSSLSLNAGEYPVVLSGIGISYTVRYCCCNIAENNTIETTTWL